MLMRVDGFQAVFIRLYTELPTRISFISRHHLMESAEIVISSISRCARGLLGPCGAMKFCENQSGFESGNILTAIDGYELMAALNVNHPAAMLLRDAVNAQEVCVHSDTSSLHAHALPFVGGHKY